VSVDDDVVKSDRHANSLQDTRESPREPVLIWLLAGRAGHPAWGCHQDGGNDRCAVEAIMTMFGTCAEGGAGLGVTGHAPHWRLRCLPQVVRYRRSSAALTGFRRVSR
jgi:hypothetical protein